MPRGPRPFQPNSIYHVTDRGVDRRRIFNSDDDRRYFLGSLCRELRRSACSLLAYCLMPNHFHALVAVSKTPLSTPLHSSLTAYALRFNALNGRVGHLFQSRYHATPIRNLAHLHNAITYIHENPVRAGLERSVDAWAWSSHNEWATLSSSRIDFKRAADLTGIATIDLREAYLNRVRLMANGGPEGLDLIGLLADTAQMFGMSHEELQAKKRGGVHTHARDLAIKRALKAGHPAIDIARALNCTEAAISLARKRGT